MTTSLLHGGRDELKRLFDEVAEEFSRLGITGEVLMVGGSWMSGSGCATRRAMSILLEGFRSKPLQQLRTLPNGTTSIPTR